MAARLARTDACTMLQHRYSLLTAATVCAALVFPTVASAEDFCVGTPAGCNGTPVPGPLLNFALTQAQTNGTDDRFFIAPGTFATTKFSYQSGERVQLIGAGAGKTILTGNVDGSVLELAGNQDSSVSDLTLQPTGSASGGLALVGASAHGVAVDATGIASLITGVQLFGDATFDNGSVDLGTIAQPAVVVYTTGTVSDSKITAPAGAAFAAGGSEATLRRSTLDAKFGAIAAHGHLTVSDTLVDLRGHAAGGPAMGLYVSPNSGGNGTTTATADADRLTIVGSTPGTSDTVGVASFADGAGVSAGVHLRDSVISGIGVPLGRQADNGATANLTTSRSVYTSPVASFDTGPGSIVEENRLNVSPRFVGNGDFHLAADSALIDAGTPGATGADATDRDGLPRASDGNGDCTHVSDIGAFEYQGTQVKATATAATASVGAGQPAGFSAAGSCIPGPEAATVAWSFDDGATGSGATVSHAFRTAGRHTATVTVSDGRGHQASAAAAVDVTTQPPAPPRFSRLRVAPARVEIGTPLPKLVRTAVRRPLGTISFRLSKAATVTLRFANVGRHDKPRPLTTQVKVRARAGLNRIRFAARLTRKVALTPGSYRLTAVATDRAGNHSARASTRFAVVGPSGR
jgi:PKD domain